MLRPNVPNVPSRIGLGRGVLTSSGLKSRNQVLETEVAALKKHLEGVRLTGHKYLKPPGVRKTLQHLQEEHVYWSEMANMDDNERFSPRARQF